MGATITAAGAGNWSAAGTWTGGVVPGDGDTANLNGFSVVMDITRVPAAGTLLAITSPSKIGNLTVAMDVLGDCSIFATTINPNGENNGGMIIVSGAAPTKTLTITATVLGPSSSNCWRGISFNSTASLAIVGTVTGGGTSPAVHCYAGNASVSNLITGGYGTNGFGVQWASTGTLTVPAGVTGGTGWNAYGIQNTSSGAINETGNVTGGSGRQAHGIYHGGTGVVTLNSCNLIDGAGGVAFGGKPPTWNITAANYHQLAAGKRLFVSRPGAGNLAWQLGGV